MPEIAQHRSGDRFIQEIEWQLWFLKFMQMCRVFPSFYFLIFQKCIITNDCSRCGVIVDLFIRTLEEPFTKHNFGAFRAKDTVFRTRQRQTPRGSIYPKTNSTVTITNSCIRWLSDCQVQQLESAHSDLIIFYYLQKKTV